MTLGGLALAVGILVDEATVCIENVHAHLQRGESLATAALNATTETTGPRLLAMLCIVAMFTPTLFMTGAAKAMFLPLAIAVGFSMVFSYLLSSSLVPIMSIWLLRKHAPSSRRSTFSSFQQWYAAFVSRIVQLRWLVLIVYLAVTGLTVLALGRAAGTEIFPRIDAGQLQIRLRAPAGTRVERTEALALQTLEIIKREVGAQNVNISLGFVGVHAPSYPINLIYLWNGGSEEGVVQVQLKPGFTMPISDLRERLRARLRDAMPDVAFSFEPSDIVSRVMSLGSPTPIEVAVSGPNSSANREFATRVRDRLEKVPALRDVQFGQSLDYPSVDVVVNRERAGLMGVKMSDVSRSLVTATSSSRFVVPNYWADPNSGVAYQIQVQIPPSRMTSLEEAKNIPVAFQREGAILLRNVAQVKEGAVVGQYQRYNMQRMITVTANLAGTDLGTAARQVASALKELGDLPPKVTLSLRGQIVPLRQMLGGLQTGLLLAVAVIILLLAANFQSFKLAFVVISTVPAVIAGVLIALFLGHATVNLQSFMGAIMAVGVAVANAILVATFAERARMRGEDAVAAAVEGAQTRLRPVLMTSLAMMAGMLPMALAVGKAGEQNAPLGLAVLGGLAAATIATLLVLPAIFAIVQARSSRRDPSLDPALSVAAPNPP